MTPEKMREAGALTKDGVWINDANLVLIIDAFDLVIAFLEGSDENRWALSVLRRDREEMLSFRAAREKP